MSNFSIIFVADSSGGSISFQPAGGLSQMSIDNVTLKRELTSLSEENADIKEFLIGSTDDGKEISFRADTQMIQLLGDFEVFGNPIAIVTKSQRGSLVKCFIALGDEEFYELEGNATKGVSIVKVHSQNRNEIETPPIAREVRISWRDYSMQLCRLTQGSIIFFPTTMSHTE